MQRGNKNSDSIDDRDHRRVEIEGKQRMEIEDNNGRGRRTVQPPVSTYSSDNLDKRKLFRLQLRSASLRERLEGGGRHGENSEILEAEPGHPSFSGRAPLAQDGVAEIGEISSDESHEGGKEGKFCILFVQADVAYNISIIKHRTIQSRLSFRKWPRRIEATHRGNAMFFNNRGPSHRRDALLLSSDGPVASTRRIALKQRRARRVDATHAD